MAFADKRASTADPKLNTTVTTQSDAGPKDEPVNF